MKATALRSQLASALPFYYGWVIVANTVAVSFSTRTLMAVAMLSIFVEPMTRELGWSRGLLSGAVSLGGLCAAITSPLLGRWLDRSGSGTIVAVSSVVTGLLAIGLATVTNPIAFYFLYVPGRMLFAGPIELALPTAISNWFIRRRVQGLAIDEIAKAAGLAVIAFMAQLIISGWDWRTAWIALGILAFVLGVLPSLLLVARRPEDMGLQADPMPTSVASPAAGSNTGPATSNSTADTEVNFTVRQALHTRAFWILAAFSGTGLMAQAGISLHQVAHYINLGVPNTAAALTASTFVFAHVPSVLFWSALGRRFPIR